MTATGQFGKGPGAGTGRGGDRSEAIVREGDLLRSLAVVGSREGRGGGGKAGEVRLGFIWRPRWCSLMKEAGERMVWEAREGGAICCAMFIVVVGSGGRTGGGEAASFLGG